VHYIRFPKSTSGGLAFSADGTLMALAQRSEGSDSVQIHACEDSWGVVRSFGIETEDVADVSWAPHAHVLCVLDAPTKHQVLLYTSEGECLRRFAPGDEARGIRQLSWSPDGRFLKYIPIPPICHTPFSPYSRFLFDFSAGSLRSEPLEGT
jgi:WD40 repeat protein